MAIYIIFVSIYRTPVFTSSSSCTPRTTASAKAETCLTPAVESSARLAPSSCATSLSSGKVLHGPAHASKATKSTKHVMEINEDEVDEIEEEVEKAKKRVRDSHLAIQNKILEEIGSVSV
jgi:lipopolysaccharide biosynthesis regulator YciM